MQETEMLRNAEKDRDGENKYYEKVSLLGEGAFAKVYLMRDAEGALAAGKVCCDGRLLRREMAVQSMADHPLFPKCLGICTDIGSGAVWRDPKEVPGAPPWEKAWENPEKSESEDAVCLMMEYVPGVTLERWLKEKGTLPEPVVTDICLQLAEGLRYLHRLPERLLFRDVKPGNIILTQDGGVKLIDFGCVCPAGRNPGVAGTPGFAAPEQLRFGGRLAENCDVYALGRILSVMAGKKCSGYLRRVAEACTRQEPERRPPDMDWVTELLLACGERSGTEPPNRMLQGNGAEAGKRTEQGSRAERKSRAAQKNMEAMLHGDTEFLKTIYLP